ncbi:MAG: hypothetical protein JO123_03630 [Ktedonobacteraceae bacterium]|nr:hypothetical protein [Ktedonobacteraceae bacterium]
MDEQTDDRRRTVLRLKNPAIVSSKPRTHIYCTGGGVILSLMRHLGARRTLPPREPGWHLRHVPTGHDAMITKPRELADLLLEAATGGASRLVTS